MTPAEWKQAEGALQGSFGSVKLLVDGYELTLVVQPLKALRYVIGVYVNGWMKGEWMLHDCEERRRFLRPLHFSAYTPAMKKSFAKMGKRTLKAANIDLTRKLTQYLPHWSSFGSLKRHLVANNKSIELKEVL